MNRRHLLLLMFFVTLLLGCNSDDRMPTYKVSGKIQFPDGSALPGGSILCLSDGTAGKTLSARGQIQSDGTFVLGTHAQDDGAVEGTHRVAIDPPLPQNYDADAGPPPRVIHERFTDYDTSGLEFTVTKDGPNEVTLTVSKK